MEDYLAIERNKLLIYATIRINLEKLMLSETARQMRSYVV